MQIPKLSMPLWRRPAPNMTVVRPSVADRIRRFRDALHELFTSRYVLHLERENARLQSLADSYHSTLYGVQPASQNAPTRVTAPPRSPQPHAVEGQASDPLKYRPAARWPGIRAELEATDRAAAGRVTKTQVAAEREQILTEARRERERILKEAGATEPTVQPESMEANDAI